MVISVSTDRSCWHKCTIGADRGGEIFDMLPRRGIGPVVPVPESAVDQFSGLSGARPQSGFAGKVSVLRMPLSSCPGLWPPFAVSLGLMHFHQYLLFGGVLEGGRRPGILEAPALFSSPATPKKHHPPKPHTHMGMLGPVPIGANSSGGLGPRSRASKGRQ